MKYPCIQNSAFVPPQPPHNYNFTTRSLSKGVPVGATNRLFAAAITSNVRRRHRFRQPECGDCRRRPRRRRRHPQWQLQSPQPVSNCRHFHTSVVFPRALLGCLVPVSKNNGSVKGYCFDPAASSIPDAGCFRSPPIPAVEEAKRARFPTGPSLLPLGALFRRASKMAVRRSWY